MDFDYRHKLIRTGQLNINDHQFSAQNVIEALEPVLTSERKQRISQVINSRTWNVAVVLESIYDTGNMAAVMRSAESFGFLPFHIIEKPGATYKKSERVSKGSEKWLHIQKHTDSKVCVHALQSQGYKVYAATLDEAVDIEQLDFSTPTALVFGNEKDGVSQELLEEVDGRFLIPMSGFTQSFNISVAAALSFYHVFRKRPVGDLNLQEKENLIAQYFLRTVGNETTIRGLLSNCT